MESEKFSDEKEKAIDYLIDELPKATLLQVHEQMQEKGFGWKTEFHHGFGTRIRNLLRKGGFEWNPIVLDEIWADLIEIATKRVLGN